MNTQEPTEFGGPVEEVPTTTVDLTQVGQPTPNGFQVQQVRIGNKMFVKLIIASPTGLDVHFVDGDAAERLASNLKKAGRACKAGIWSGVAAQ